MVAGVLAVAVVIGGVVLFRGGGDDSTADARKTPSIEDVPSEKLPGETETADPEPLAPEVTMTTPSQKSAEASPQATPTVPENVDGCDHAYGATICVPWSFPAGVTTQKQKCDWLKQRGFTYLPVPGRDRHGLDPDKNKMACDN